MADDFDQDVIDNDVEVPDNEPSLSDTVREAYETAKNNSDEDVTSKGDRDANGRFTTNKPQSKHPSENENPSVDSQNTAANNTTSQPVVTGLNPPTNWSAEAKADFNKLPAHVQQAIATREEQISNGFKVLQNYKGLDAFQPYIQNAKSTYAGVIENAIKWEEASITNPIGTILHLAQTRGINPQQLIQAIQNPAYGRQFARQVQHPQPKALTADEYKQIARQEYQAVQQDQAINQQIETFWNDPKYPHTAKVVDDMVMLINSDRAKDLPTAYRMAVQLHPELAQNPQNRLTTNPLDRKRVAAKAVTGAPKSTTSASGREPEYNTVRDAVRAAYAQHAQ
jgi:hypothetical protein